MLWVKTRKINENVHGRELRSFKALQKDLGMQNENRVFQVEVRSNKGTDLESSWNSRGTIPLWSDVHRSEKKIRKTNQDNL